MANGLGPRRLGLRTAGALAAVLLMFVGAPGGLALASSGWSVEPSIPPRATHSDLAAVSCSSLGSCTAVGYQHNRSGRNVAESRSANRVPPAVTNVSPNSGPAAGGTVVTITGSGFTRAFTVPVRHRVRGQRDRQQRDPDHCV
jgi:hypothetical protein